MESRSDAENDPLDADACRRSPRTRRGGGSGGGCLAPWQWPPRRSMNRTRTLITPRHHHHLQHQIRRGRSVGSGSEEARKVDTIGPGVMRIGGGKRARRAREGLYKLVRAAEWWCGGNPLRWRVSMCPTRSRSPRRHQPGSGAARRRGIIRPAITYVVAGHRIIARLPGRGVKSPAGADDGSTAEMAWASGSGPLVHCVIFTGEV